jgi:hypothetical protein
MGASLTNPGSLKPTLRAIFLKVVPIQGTGQAFTPQDFIVLKRLWDATIGMDAGKIQFPAGLEQIQTLLQDNGKQVNFGGHFQRPSSTALRVDDKGQHRQDKEGWE